eukprot:PITA_31342
MTSRQKFHLVKVEEEEDCMLEEEEEAHTEVEEEALQAQVEGATIKIQVKAQAKIKHKVRSMINLKLNAITVRNDPIHFKDAVKEEKWVLEMEEEIEAVEKNDTWELVNLLQGKYVVGVKWVYNTKRNVDVILVSRFMETPKEMHWKALKIILRYVNGAKEYGIQYAATNYFGLVGYTDSDWVGSVNDRKITSGYVFHLGFGAISWASKKKPIVSFSTTKVEYVTTTAAACQVV